jgi:hypothetical protein
MSAPTTSRPKQLLRLLAAALAGALGAFTVPAAPAGAHTAGQPAATASSAATVGEKQPD